MHMECRMFKTQELQMTMNIIYAWTGAAWKLCWTVAKSLNTVQPCSACVGGLSGQAFGYGDCSLTKLQA